MSTSPDTSSPQSAMTASTSRAPSPSGSGLSSSLAQGRLLSHQVKLQAPRWEAWATRDEYSVLVLCPSRLHRDHALAECALGGEPAHLSEG